MATAYQLMKYIDVIKAKSKKRIYNGRKVPEYQIVGTKDYIEIKKIRDEIYDKIMKKDNTQED